MPSTIVEGVPKDLDDIFDTESAWPLKRAHQRVAALAAERGIDEALREAATHRGEYMWPWGSGTT